MKKKTILLSIIATFVTVSVAMAFTYATVKKDETKTNCPVTKECPAAKCQH